MQHALNQAFDCAAVPGEVMDQLWAAGWRHFGTLFFRYSEMEDAGGMLHVTPLRMDLGRFTVSKSQRRVLRRNADMRTEFAPARLSEEAREMFHRHKLRFENNVPETLECFLSDEPGSVPCECVECRVWWGDVLVAVSFLDVGVRATSAVYGVFDPDYGSRSLGVFTMLKEIEFSQARGAAHYYPGYATREPSAYDYKKRFAGLEVLDWADGTWRELPAAGADREGEEL